MNEDPGFRMSPFRAYHAVAYGAAVILVSALLWSATVGTVGTLEASMRSRVVLQFPKVGVPLSCIPVRVDIDSTITNIPMPWARARPTYLDSYVRLEASPEFIGSFAVIVGFSDVVSDVSFVLLASDTCVWWGGRREVEVAEIPPTAVTEWNAIVDSLERPLQVYTPTAARIATLGFLVFATGRPIVLENDATSFRAFAHGSALRGLSWWQSHVASVVYKKDEMWVVDGLWDQKGGSYAFHVVLTKTAQVHTVWMRDRER